MPAIAIGAVLLLADAGRGGLAALGPGATMALALAAAVFGRYPVELGPRTIYSLDTPVVLMAGLLGGPVAGALVGAASGIGDVGGVWRRRLAYAGITALQGVAAGQAGLAWQDGRIGAVGAASLGAAGMIVVGTTGLVLVQLERRSFSPRRAAWSAATDLVALALSIAPVTLLALAYASRQGLVLAATGSVAVTAVVVARFGEQREAAAAERHQALVHDWLTGAASRGFFEVELERAREAVLRGAHPAGLLVVDADRFKDVNDGYGHQVGDGVLRELVRRVERCARAGDLVARWGGDEFCVLAPGLGGIDDLLSLAERIRAEVASAPFVVSGETIAMTVSAGGTMLDGSLRAADVFDRADSALYRAKRERNAICVLPVPASAVPSVGRSVTASA